MFDVYGVEGPVAVNANGDIVFIDKNKTVPVKHGLSGSLRLLRISRDGLRFLLAEHGPGGLPWRTVLVHTLNGQTTAVKADHPSVLEPQLPQFARPRVLRHKLRAIAVDRQGRLALQGRHDHLWPLMLDPRSQKILLPSEYFVDPSLTTLPLESIDAGEAYTLKTARWPDGSQVWLDARGLLHLRSSDPQVPQCSIVLTQGETAGWTSDGRMWGPRYFLGDHPATLPQDIYRDVIQAFIERLP
jgi:hypothetical protein